jgi:hypothetical protein
MEKREIKKIIIFAFTVVWIIFILWLMNWLIINAQEASNFLFKHNIIIPNFLKTLTIRDVAILTTIILFITIIYKINGKKSIRKCPECGEEVKKDSGYCGKCGEKLPSVKAFIIGSAIGFILLLGALAIESKGTFRTPYLIVIELTLIFFTLRLPVYKD